jgi:hypothetical protein
LIGIGSGQFLEINGSRSRYFFTIAKEKGENPVEAFWLLLIANSTAGKIAAQSW